MNTVVSCHFRLEIRMNLEILFSTSMLPLHNRRSCVHTVHQQMCGFHETLVRSRCDMLHVKLLPGQHNLFTVVVVVKRKLAAISWLLLYQSVVVVHVFDLLWNTCNGCVDVEQMSRRVAYHTQQICRSEQVGTDGRPKQCVPTRLFLLHLYERAVSRKLHYSPEYPIWHFLWLLFCSAAGKFCRWERNCTIESWLYGSCYLAYM